MITELPPMRAAICGDEKTWKSAFGLSFPRPIRHFDIDIGGYERATWCNMPVPRIDLEDITSESYRVAIDETRLLASSEDKPTVRFTHRVTGYREVWRKIVIDFVAACKDPKVKTIVMDSATQLWFVCHTAFLQEKQEIQMANKPGIQDKDLRERLQPVEFPNDRLYQIVYTARACDKNLVMIHYPRDKYIRVMNKDTEKMEDQKSGEKELDGFKHTEKIIDIVIWTEFKSKKEGRDTVWFAEAKISRCGYPGLGTAAQGWELPTPDYQGLVSLYKMINGIEEE